MYPVILEMFEGFGNNEVFVKSSTQWMVGQLLALSDAREPDRQPRVVEIELGALDVAFGDVAMPGGEPIEDKATFQHGEPFTGGGLRDASIGGEAV